MIWLGKVEITLRKGLLVEVPGVTKTRVFPTKSGQNISSSVGFTKTRAFAAKSCQNISSSVVMTKSRAFVWAAQMLSKYF